MDMKEKKIVRIITYFYLVPFLVIVTFNAGNSLFRTGYFDLYQYVEIIQYDWNNPILTVLFSVAVVFLVRFVLSRK